jgi:hypothetical protein
VAFAALAAEPADKSAPDAPVHAPTQQPAAAGNAGVNRVTQAAVQAGVLACAGRINQVSNFVTASAQNSGGYRFPPGPNADRSLVSASLEVQYKDGALAYVSTSFAPNHANGCGALYESVAWSEGACDAVAKAQFGALSPIGVLGKSTIVLTGSGTMNVFLLAARLPVVVVATRGSQKHEQAASYRVARMPFRSRLQVPPPLSLRG